MSIFAFHNINHIRFAGRPDHPCEDLVSIDNATLLLMDGASPLGPSIMPPSDAAWFVRETSRILKKSLPGHDCPLTEILSFSMEELLPRWTGPSADMPSAGIALVRLKENHLEYLLLGDCSISIEKRDGTTLSSADKALRRLDFIALSELQSHAARLGASPRDCLPLIQDILRQNRSLRNTPEGYPILDPSGKGIPYAKTGTLPAADVQSILLCSDGFAQLSEFTGESLPHLHKRAKGRSLPALYHELCSHQDSDPTFDRVPRFKHRDDASSIIASITTTKKGG